MIPNTFRRIALAQGCLPADLSAPRMMPNRPAHAQINATAGATARANAAPAAAAPARNTQGMGDTRIGDKPKP